MMQRLRHASLILAVLALASPAWPAADCQYVQVVDSCGKKVFILDVGAPAATCFVALDEGPAGAYAPWGVDHATVPEKGDFFSFVSQGPFLRVLFHEVVWTNGYDPDEGLSPFRIVDLEQDLSLAGIELAGLDASGPVVINGQTRYLLYAAGTRVGESEEPWFVVFDQEALLTTGTFEPSWTLRFAGPLCPGAPTCAGAAVDVSAGAQLADGSQEVYFSVLAQVDGQSIQQFRKVVFQASGAYAVTLDPWNDEGVPFDGSEAQALGLDHEALGLEAHGVFPTSSMVSDLQTGAPTCELGPGDLTDLAIWGPDTWLDHTYVEFAAASNLAGVGILLGYPEGVCPYSSYAPPVIATGAVVQAVGSRPLALALSSVTDRRPWVYTANGSGGVSAVRVDIGHDPSDGDVIEILEQLEIPLQGCPAAVSIRDDLYEECMYWLDAEDPDPTGPRPDDFCDLYPTDPWCLKELEPHGGGGGSG